MLNVSGQSLFVTWGVTWPVDATKTLSYACQEQSCRCQQDPCWL